ncbi:hypothetical protein [Embleya scabrispora]|uniref:hypothetical protein n=1 Tax=Embleya scabrispora TaxID=159449 RepID=UPI00036B6D6A|nr:hypothetical protein [Embleya scabrispora]MYS85913.1 hypothetical protein [Streptomyces sp. SID5474]
MSRTDGAGTTGYAVDTGELHGLVRRLHNIGADYLARGCFAEPARVAAYTALGTDALGALPGAAELTERHRLAAARMVELLAQIRAELATTHTELGRTADRFTSTETEVGTLLRTAASR